jgi:hypothetical protein
MLEPTDEIKGLAIINVRAGSKNVILSWLVAVERQNLKKVS